MDLCAPSPLSLTSIPSLPSPIECLTDVAMGDLSSMQQGMSQQPSVSDVLSIQCIKELLEEHQGKLLNRLQPLMLSGQYVLRFADLLDRLEYLVQELDSIGAQDSDGYVDSDDEGLESRFRAHPNLLDSRLLKHSRTPKSTSSQFPTTSSCQQTIRSPHVVGTNLSRSDSHYPLQPSLRSHLRTFSTIPQQHLSSTTSSPPSDQLQQQTTRNSSSPDIVSTPLGPFQMIQSLSTPTTGNHVAKSQ